MVVIYWEGGCFIILQLNPDVLVMLCLWAVACTSESQWYSYFFPFSLLPSLAVALLSCSFGALPPGDFASLCFPDIRWNEKTGRDWRERQTPSPDGMRLLQCFYPWRVGICGGKCLDTYFSKDSSFPRWHLFFIHLSVSELRST